MCILRTPGRGSPPPSGCCLALPSLRTGQPQPASLSTADALNHCSGGDIRGKQTDQLSRESGRLAISYCSTCARYEATAKPEMSDVVID